MTTTNPHVVELHQLDDVHAGDLAVIRAEVGSDIAPQVDAGTVRAITAWHPMSTWYLIEFTTPILGGMTRFPVAPTSLYTFVRAFRTNNEENTR